MTHNLTGNLLPSFFQGNPGTQMVSPTAPLQFCLKRRGALFSINKQNFMCRVNIAVQPPNHYRPHNSNQEIQKSHRQHRRNMLHKFPTSNQRQLQISSAIDQHCCIRMGKNHFYILLMDHTKSGKYFAYQHIQSQIQGQQRHITPKVITTPNNPLEIILLKPCPGKSPGPQKKKQCCHQHKK